MNPLEQLKKRIVSLKKNHVFTFLNISTNTKISKDNVGKYGKFIWEYEDILTSFESIENAMLYFKDKLLANEVVIGFRKKNGSKTIKTEIQDVVLTLQSSENPQPTTHIDNTPNMTPQEPQPQPQQFLAGNSMTVPLGFAEYSDLRDSRTKLGYAETENTRLIEENRKLKIDLEESKRKANNEKDALQLKINKAENQCALNEEKLQLALDRKDLEKKGFMDSDVGLGLVNNIGGILAAFSGKSIPEVPLSGGNNTTETPEEITEYQKQVLSLIKEGTKEDADAIFYYDLASTFNKRPDFRVMVAGQLTNFKE